MAYKKNFVAAIKVNGQILRESNDRVELPFGSEYAILLKNLDTVRMQARISIDGQDATGWLIVEPGRHIDVERFVKDLDRGNRFKFIERAERIEEHRGVKIDDGLVRVEFKREKVFEAPKLVYHHYDYHYYPGGCYSWGTFGLSSSFLQANQNYAYDGHRVQLTASCSTGGIRGSSAGILSAMNMNTMKSVSASSGAEQIPYQAQNDVGITVPGSISDQKFISVSGFETEAAEVIILYLVGKIASKPVKVAKTVKTKIECDTCGKKNKSSAKFCVECGTSLEKV